MLVIMQQMKAILTILTLISTHCSESLPITSKALDDNSDQLIWQSAWYSQRVNEERKESPFTGDSKRITAKSIFITPNFNQNASHCPPGYKIDDVGKCIKLVNINQDNILVTRLQNYFSHHQKTEDITNNDYDYSLEEDTSEPTQFTLPLIPILNNQETDLVTIDKPPTSTQEYRIELNEFSFAPENSSESKLDNSSEPATAEDMVNAVASSTSYEIVNSENDASLQQSKLHESSSIWSLNSDESSQETTENPSSLENTKSYASELSIEQLSTDLRDISEEDENYPQTTSIEMVNRSENNTEEEKAISNSSNTIHLDDYFDTLFKNESLFIDKTSSYENLTDFDDDTATTTELISPDQFIEESSGDGRVESLELATRYHPIIIKADVQTAPTISSEEISFKEEKASDKFVYEHVLPTPSTSNRISKTQEGIGDKIQKVRFPDDDVSKIRFPDDNVSISWPHDDRYRLMLFWQDQPLIDDVRERL